MAETWHKESCAACGKQNWLPQLSEDDIAAFKCWSCGQTTRLFSGSMQDEYDPHLEGTPNKGYEPDESPPGLEWDGKEQPT